MGKLPKVTQQANYRSRILDDYEVCSFHFKMGICAESCEIKCKCLVGEVGVEGMDTGLILKASRESFIKNRYSLQFKK